MSRRRAACLPNSQLHRLSVFTSSTDPLTPALPPPRSNGAYLIKTVAAGASFRGADLSDVLMDRAVIVDADLSDAILVRAIFTRSDFGRSTIAGADFSAALVDKDQQVGVYQSFY